MAPWLSSRTPLPLKLSYEPLLPRLSEASMRLGELNGIGQLLVNPYLLIRPLQRKETVASSNIEGTYTLLSDLFLLEAGADKNARPPDTGEVRNYVLALEHAIARMEELPVGLRLMKKAHQILLSGVRGIVARDCRQANSDESRTGSVEVAPISGWPGSCHPHHNRLCPHWANSKSSYKTRFPGIYRR